MGPIRELSDSKRVHDQPGEGFSLEVSSSMDIRKRSWASGVNVKSTWRVSAATWAWNMEEG